MKTIKLTREADEQRRLPAQVPPDVGPGAVQVVILVADGDEDAAAVAWKAWIAREWAVELEDGRQDIYSFGDGKPIT